MVFGNERDGLSDHELSLCSLAVHIPSSDKFPSLNVAQPSRWPVRIFYQRYRGGKHTGGIEKVGSAKPGCPRGNGIFSPARSRGGAAKTSGQGQDKGHVLSRLGIELGVDEIIGAFAERGAFKQSDDSFLRGFCGTSAKGRA
jgi:hypothetical protein